MMKYTSHLLEQGYSFIPGKQYGSFARQNEHIKHLRSAFPTLKMDPYSPGNRYRSYIQCKINRQNELVFGHFEPYLQTKQYNPDTGGIIRNYPMISEKVLQNPIFTMLLKADIEFVKQYQEIGAPCETQMWIHLFRYKATADSPAFSSPVWLHKDDEDVVFVHLINSSKNMIGGDNLIATDAKTIERVIKLENLFDTLVVNHKKYHAVTPVGCNLQFKQAYSTRDVILITFQKMRSFA